jgi:hypothetical protein
MNHVMHLTRDICMLTKRYRKCHALDMLYEALRDEPLAQLDEVYNITLMSVT